MPVVEDATQLGFAEEPLARLDALIRRHIAEGRYPGCQIALARHGRFAFVRAYGKAAIESATPADDRTIWLLYSGTKPLAAALIWRLVEEGVLSFADRVADHLPGFDANGKGEVTILQLLTHQAGFPNAVISEAAWQDHALLAREVAAIELEWEPGSRTVYHMRSAHWVVAALVEAVTGVDFRVALKERLLAPLGLERDIFVGFAGTEKARIAPMYACRDDGSIGQIESDNSALWLEAGIPSSGGYATAQGLAAYYQMLINGGELGGVRLFSPRLVSYATQNFTGERVDELFKVPMRRALGPHVRGEAPLVRSLGTLAHPRTIGQGGNGCSVAWGDPDSGVSFAYLTNLRTSEPWHSARLEYVSNLVHTAIR
ncbi:serine hydrolase domain-containing protein [Cupriavidus sp. CV2]|uniref:serine hydrolase domain-containing protein n=1 Tax=Cupriavidus ulmosensis TaxID=3065913 RepID=UPI00296B4B82|nr:serine hydrolase domain-containing protein [Cupriavidus sp. CV2]MDW3686596.1 serine hydrolase domain-containing protein [Cupriavidus sp. CV2]